MADFSSYSPLTSELDPPFAVVDLGAFRRNADDLVQRAGGTPIRVAAKSVRCRSLLTETLAPLVGRPVDSLRHLPIGSAEQCAQRLAAFAAAGVERLMLWPLADEIAQLEVVRERVLPLVDQPGVTW